mmetsp:Transcript_37500/g.92225  ORF Transcript_37500/g.92225 Transcript_37500/m.92225 type:complete len:272 (+) Transcript_37500:208-1023(+)
MASVVTVPTVSDDVSLSASGMSSANTIHSIVPAAHPKPIGSRKLKSCTKKKEGTAMRGCGSDEHTAHNEARHGFSPRGTDTRATARPSGMLWIPMARVMKMPCWRPLSPPYETPTPRPSEKECSVMMPTTSIALRASKPLRSPISMSCPSTYFCERMMKTSPDMMPRKRRQCPPSLETISIPSWMSPKLAASMTPEASALQHPSQCLSSFRTKKKGTAPRPVATAMSSVYAATLHTPMCSCCAMRCCGGLAKRSSSSSDTSTSYSWLFLFS